jgi:hypothetical protein
MEDTPSYIFPVKLAKCYSLFTFVLNSIRFMYLRHKGFCLGFSFCPVASKIPGYHSFLFHLVWLGLMYHYQFQKNRCMQLEMIYAIFIIGNIPTSRCRHLRYVNEQITPHFWLCINNMYHVTQE